LDDEDYAEDRTISLVRWVIILLIVLLLILILLLILVLIPFASLEINICYLVNSSDSIEYPQWTPRAICTST
jgi:uncharacterized integral membrane protein